MCESRKTGFGARAVMKPRRLTLAVLVACGALAGCEGGREAKERALLADGGSGATESAREYRAIDYEVSSGDFRRWVESQRGLDEIRRLNPPVRIDARDVREADVDRVVDYLERHEEARRAIENSGLSVREYVLTSVALAQALLASDETRPVRFRDLPRENTEFVARYVDNAFRHRDGWGRVAVVDDRDSDNEDSDSRRGRGHRRGRDSDRDSDSDKDTDKDIDRDTDRH